MSKQEIKLCILGDVSVGKSCLGSRFVSEVFDPRSVTTVGASYMSKAIAVGDRTLMLHIWDTAGQEKYRSLAALYYRGAAAAVLVYDVTRMDTFEALKYWINELKKLGPSDVIIAIAGNKCDLKNREVPTEHAKGYAESVGALFFETSAKTAINVQELFIEIGKRFLSKSVRTTRSKGTVVPSERDRNGKKGCC